MEAFCGRSNITIGQKCKFLAEGYDSKNAYNEFMKISERGFYSNTCIHVYQSYRLLYLLVFIMVHLNTDELCYLESKLE